MARKTTKRKKTTAARKRRSKTTTARTRRRKTTTASRRKSSSQIVNFFVPLFFIFCILFCLGFLMFMGYRTATASAFFDIERVELRGADRIEKGRVERIVRTHTAKTGVWNADLDAIRRDVAKFRYAREVSVSRVLPDTVRVIVAERRPVAVVRIDGNDRWADEEGLVLDRVGVSEKRPPFTLLGWDTNGTDRARETNRKRIGLYLRLLEDWRAYDLASRVRAVDLSDLRQPRAIIENSNRAVEIRIEGENYTRSLQKGIETVAGADGCVEYIITDGNRTTKAECRS